MRNFPLVSMAICGVFLAAAPAIAASDYFLKIEGVKGESTDRASTEKVQVSSFSWGASQTSTVAPRDAASGMPTGKRQHKPRFNPSDLSTDARVAAPAVAEDSTLALVVAEPGNTTTAQLVRMCASGEHIEKAVLIGPGERYVMKDVVISSCAASGDERKIEFRGHITLMK